jgi:hypothetical protein
MIGNDWPSISDETSEYQVAKIPGIGTLVQGIIQCTRSVQEDQEDEARSTSKRERRAVERPDVFSSVGSSEQSQSAETARTDDTFLPGSFDVDEDVFDQLRGLLEILSEKVIQEYLRFLLNWCVQQPNAMPDEVHRYEYQVQTQHTRRTIPLPGGRTVTSVDDGSVVLKVWAPHLRFWSLQKPPVMIIEAKKASGQLVETKDSYTPDDNSSQERNRLAQCFGEAISAYMETSTDQDQ